MPELKLVINNKDGKSYPKVLEDPSIFSGRKINETISGDLIGLTGYELKITGGSDSSGFPMRKEINSTGKKKIFAKAGIGINPKFKGTYLRKTMAGNTIHDKTAQVNLIVTQQGKKALNDLLGKKEEAPKKEEDEGNTASSEEKKEAGVKGMSSPQKEEPKKETKEDSKEKEK